MRMPSRLVFKVIEASSEDDDFKAFELNVQEPTNKGWRSHRDAIFPHHIVLELGCQAHIKKLQLLSHHSMISKKLEIHVGNYQNNYKSIDFIELGQVSLANHKNSTCKVRELKSVYVDAVGKFIKLSLGEAHLQEHNLYNQVSLMAVNIFGNYTYEEADLGDAKSCGLVREADFYSPTDDLSFPMYHDAEAVRIIKQLEEKMMRDEDYNVNELRSVISKLEQIGKVLLDLEATKRRLLETEDDPKRSINVGNEINQMRGRMHCLVEHLNVSSSLPLAIPPPYVKIVGSNPSTHTLSLEPITLDVDSASSTPRNELNEGSKTPESSLTREFDASNSTNSQQSVKALPTSSNQNAYYDYNERPVPTHRKGRGRRLEEVSECDEEPTRDDNDSSLYSLAEELSEADEKDAAHIIEVFGVECARRIFSKKWNHKQEGLHQISKCFSERCCNDDVVKKVEASSGGEVPNARCPLHEVSMTTVTKAVEHVIMRVSKDNILSVFKSSLVVYNDFLLNFVPVHDSMPKLDLFLERTLPPLLMRLADISSNLRHTASSLVVELSKSSDFKYKNFLLMECMKMTRNNAPSRMVLGVTELLFTIYQEQGMIDSGLTMDSLLTYLSECSSNNCSNVRKFAKDFLSRLRTDLLTTSIQCRVVEDVTMVNEIGRMLSDFDSVDKKTKLEVVALRSDVKVKEIMQKDTPRVGSPRPLVHNRKVAKENKVMQSRHPMIKKPLKVAKENQTSSKTNAKQVAKQPPPTKTSMKKLSPHRRSMPSIAKGEPTVTTKQPATSSRPQTSKQQRQLSRQPQQLKTVTDRQKGDKTKNAKRRSISFDRKSSRNRIDLPVIGEEFKDGKKGKKEENEGTCVFCGMDGVPFNEKVVDHHYFNECPMLVQCSHCKTTLEVSDLSRHRVESCEQRSLFRKCLRCKNAVLLSGNDDDHAGGRCREVKDNEQACPMCGVVVNDDQDSWKNHLARSDGCHQRSNESRSPR